MNRHRAQVQHRAAVRFSRQPREIERQPIADIHAGVQFVAIGQQQGLVNAGFEIEMPSQDAAAKGAGDNDLIAGFCAAAD